MNKKGFTLIELLAVIVILAVLAGIAVLSYNSIMEGTKKKVYTNYEASMVNVTKIYFLDHADEIGTDKIYLNKLVGENYLDQFENPDDSADSCLKDSYVLVTKSSTNNFNYTYKACLICQNYKSEGCN